MNTAPVIFEVQPQRVLSQTNMAFILLIHEMYSIPTKYTEES